MPEIEARTLSTIAMKTYYYGKPGIRRCEECMLTIVIFIES
jgi:hypothetical protein